MADVIARDVTTHEPNDALFHADRRFETMHNCAIVLDQLEEVMGRT